MKNGAQKSFRPKALSRSENYGRYMYGYVEKPFGINGVYIFLKQKCKDLTTVLYLMEFVPFSCCSKFKAC